MTLSSTKSRLIILLRHLCTVYSHFSIKHDSNIRGGYETEEKYLENKRNTAEQVISWLSLRKYKIAPQNQEIKSSIRIWKMSLEHTKGWPEIYSCFLLNTDPIILLETIHFFLYHGKESFQEWKLCNQHSAENEPSCFVQEKKKSFCVASYTKPCFDWISS